MSAPAAIKILSNPPLRSVLAELKPRFERANGIALLVENAPAAELKRRIDEGENFDVAILTSGLIDRFIEQGRISASARQEIARVGLGVAVRATTAKPDVASVEAFRHSLLTTRSILYASGSAVVAHIERTFERLGIAGEVKSKSRTRPAGGYIAKAIADGAAELGLTTIPTILETEGVRLAGPFPAALQFHVPLSGGISDGSARPEAAEALLRQFAATEMVELLQAKGLEAPGPTAPPSRSCRG